MAGTFPLSSRMSANFPGRLSDLIVTTTELRARAEASEKQLCDEVIKAFASLDRSDPAQLEEACALASFLYWHPLEISLEAIANGLGIHKCQVVALGFISPLDMTVDCKECGESFGFPITSRAGRDKLSIASRSGQNDFPETCGSCREKQMSRNRAFWDEESKKREALKDRLAELRSMPYREYLRSDEWRERRQRYLRSARYRCQLCNAGNCALEVHHRTYERRGDEWYNDLIVLCSRCHGTFHERLNLDPSSYGKEARS